MRQFNSEVQQQRDLFNAQNGLVVAQANAQWRQNIATLNTAAQNQSNMEFARTINALTSTNLDQVWQRERDIMSYAFTQSQSAQDRALNILLADKNLDAYREKMAQESNDAKAAVAWKVLFPS
jgi:type IV secretory pathway component VirB8